MHYVDRWILSMVLATFTLFALIVFIGIPRHWWLDMIHMWCSIIAINNIRLTLTRSRK